MTAREKAIELVEKYRVESWVISRDHDKQCALIAVNEILNNFGSRVEENIHYCNYSAIQFYEEVKSEIEKL